jgi:hypothetical protein
MDKKEGKKKSWFARHKILTGFLILIILIIVIGGFNSNSPNNSNSLNNGNSATSMPCPDLSNMKLQNYDSLMQTWIAQVSPYKSNNVEVVYTYNSQIEEKKTVIYCDVGSEEGQNANWVYCGDFLRPIVAQYTDAEGKIIKKKSVQVTFDKNTKQYLKTECDTYTLV